MDFLKDMLPKETRLQDIAKDAFEYMHSNDEANLQLKNNLIVLPVQEGNQVLCVAQS